MTDFQKKCHFSQILAWGFTNIDINNVGSIKKNHKTSHNLGLGPWNDADKMLPPISYNAILRDSTSSVFVMWHAAALTVNNKGSTYKIFYFDLTN